jgi:hypothetical protein
MRKITTEWNKEVEMPWLVLILATVFGVGMFFYKKKKKNMYDSEGTTMLLVLLGIILFVASVAWPISYAATTGRIAELEAFQESVFEAYASTIDATDKAVVRLDLEKLLVSAENIKQSTNLSDRIAELRDRVVWYNESLKRLMALDNVWWLDAYIKDVPDTLKPVKLSAEHFKVLEK